MVGSGRGSCPGGRSRPADLTWWAVRAAARLCGGEGVVDAVVAVFVAGVRALSSSGFSGAPRCSWTRGETRLARRSISSVVFSSSHLQLLPSDGNDYCISHAAMLVADVLRSVSVGDRGRESVWLVNNNDQPQQGNADLETLCYVILRRRDAMLRKDIAQQLRQKRSKRPIESISTLSPVEMERPKINYLPSTNIPIATRNTFGISQTNQPWPQARTQQTSSRACSKAAV